MYEPDVEVENGFDRLTVGEKLSSVPFLESLKKRYQREILALEAKLGRSSGTNGCAGKGRRRRDRLARLRHCCLPFVQEQISKLEHAEWVDFFAANRL